MSKPTKTINPPKPLTVAREEFIEALVKLVNGSGLPMFAVESIFKDIGAEVHVRAQQQYAHDKQTYDKEIKAGGVE